MNNKNLKATRKNLRNTATPQEIILWSKLRRSQLGYKFRRQQSIGNYIVDFYCPTLQLIVELDGWQHKEEFSGNKETKRTKFLEDQGLHILRFWNNEINNNLDNVVQLIMDTCGDIKKSKN